MARLTGLLLTLLLLPSAVPAGEVIIYTANQDWLSRIYVLNMNGTVRDFFEYSFYRFVGLEVVDNELYVAEAFAPRVYKVDPTTGDLDLVIDDWSLYYFYDLAFDGIYFYLDEWDLNRYDIHGIKHGTANFDEYVLGAAWDGRYFWTLDDTNIIKCWELKDWPAIVAVPEHNFIPPSAECRGLWFDGEYFWSAESGEGLGKIYKFDHQGEVIRWWPEPAFSGWGACMVDIAEADVESGPSPRVATCHLGANHPNPFTSKTIVEFSLPRSSHVELTVYDALGRSVDTLVSSYCDAGKHTLEWNPTGLPSGIYFYRIQGDGLDITRKMVLLE